MCVHVPVMLIFGIIFYLDLILTAKYCSTLLYMCVCVCILDLILSAKYCSTFSYIYIYELPALQFALVSLVKKMAVEHPYHTIFQVIN